MCDIHMCGACARAAARGQLPCAAACVWQGVCALAHAPCRHRPCWGGGPATQSPIPLRQHSSPFLGESSCAPNNNTDTHQCTPLRPCQPWLLCSLAPAVLEGRRIDWSSWWCNDFVPARWEPTPRTCVCACIIIASRTQEDSLVQPLPSAIV